MKTFQTTSQPRTVGEATFSTCCCNLLQHLLNDEFQQNLGKLFHLKVDTSRVTMSNPDE